MGGAADGRASAERLRACAEVPIPSVGFKKAPGNSFADALSSYLLFNPCGCVLDIYYRCPPRYGGTWRLLPLCPRFSLFCMWKDFIALVSC